MTQRWKTAAQVALAIVACLAIYGQSVIWRERRIEIDRLHARIVPGMSEAESLSLVKQRPSHIRVHESPGSLLLWTHTGPADTSILQIDFNHGRVTASTRSGEDGPHDR